MAQFDQSHYKIMTEGIRLFNSQKYWECHENLEHFWLTDQGPIRNIYWAVIQIAAAMIHYRDGNLDASKSLIVKAQKKFNKCEELKIESILLDEKLSWKELKELTMAFELKKLYEFRFKEI